MLICTEKESVKILQSEKLSVNMKINDNKDLTCITKINWSIFGLSRDEYSSIPISSNTSTFSLSLENTSSIPVSIYIASTCSAFQNKFTILDFEAHTYRS